MKKLYILSCILLLIIVLAGCALLPAKPLEVAEDVEGSGSQELVTVPEPELVEVQEPVLEPVPVSEDIAEEANVTADLKISGSLKLQSSKTLCPHLLERFECDKYELARCDFRTLVSKNDFFPDYLHCRNGYDYRGENPNHKYCFIQECRPLDENNIVYAYGGTVAYADYLYKVDKVEGGIMTTYTLYKCGEEFKEFKTSFDCKTYKSELRVI